MAAATSSLMVRLDQESKECIAKVAELRRISISDNVRLVTVSQARREVSEAQQNVLALLPAEQLAFWNALKNPAKPTAAQRQLGKWMRGE